MTKTNNKTNENYEVFLETSKTLNKLEQGFQTLGYDFKILNFEFIPEDTKQKLTYKYKDEVLAVIYPTKYLLTTTLEDIVLFHIYDNLGRNVERNVFLNKNDKVAIPVLTETRADIAGIIDIKPFWRLIWFDGYGDSRVEKLVSEESILDYQLASIAWTY